MNFRLLLLPFSLIYGIGVSFRNKLFDIGILKENRFAVPVISIGNITTGGTGKTPHIEYLLRLLSGDKKVAALSRGYGRNTDGFLYVSENAKAETVGDEPLQLKTKFNEAVVAVCEDRVIGIDQILTDNPDTSVVLLDDAFQHRSVKAGLSILLMEHSKILKQDFLLPAGNLREPFSAKKRADIIVVTKCPVSLSEVERKSVLNKITLEKKQETFFSFVSYDKQVNAVYSNHQLELNEKTNVLLVTGIADASSLVSYAKSAAKLVKHIEYGDHHVFSENELKNIHEIFSTIAAENKIILTTEKDAMRLKSSETLKDLPIYYIPVEVKFYSNDEEKFNKLILDYVGKN